MNASMETLGTSSGFPLLPFTPVQSMEPKEAFPKEEIPRERMAFRVPCFEEELLYSTLESRRFVLS